MMRNLLWKERSFMSKVKIGDKEYKLSRLNYKDVKKLNRYRTENKLDDLDFDTYILIYTLQKANPDLPKMTIDEFDELLDIGDIDRIRKEINDFSGFNKYIKKIQDEKNLTLGIGKK
jgi:hypothetical protein